MELSIIIPALNEADYIRATLASTKNGSCAERIVVDGGSKDRTRKIARKQGVQLIGSEPGRGGQLRRGAREATGDTYLFLHADSKLPQNYDRYIARILTRPGISAGAFQLSIDGGPTGTGLIERFVSFRSRVFQLPYGDQGVFVRRKVYERAGGIPPVPLMEDVLFVRRLRRFGRIGLAPVPLRTSGRRWRERGVFRNTLMNQLTLGAFFLGVSPDLLWGWYHGEQ